MLKASRQPDGHEPRRMGSIVISLLILAGCAWITTDRASGAADPNQKDGKMPAENKSPVVLLLRAQRAKPMALLPEEAAAFDMILRNDSAAAQNVLSLSGNQGTPAIRLIDAGGKVLGVYNSDIKRERNSGHKPPVQRPPNLTELEPGGAEQIEQNIWAYADPLPPGSIDVEAWHQAAEDQKLVFNRLHFDIVPSEIGNVASGYDSSARLVSVLAWIAKPAKGDGPHRLLVRMSAFASSAILHYGATAYLDVDPNARVSVGHLPPDGTATWLTWVAVAQDQQVELLRLNNTYPNFRSPKFSLPIRDAVPIPRFPDRGNALFLATGKGEKGPALAGMVVKPQAEYKPTPWSVPLAATPDRAACAFSNTGPISLLLVSHQAGQTQLSILGVDDTGAVISPEKVVRTTPNKVLAIAVYTPPQLAPSFLILEANPAKPDHLLLLRMSLAGQYKEPGNPEPQLKPARGWPTIKENDKDRPLQLSEIVIEMAPDGIPWIAMVDERGSLYQSHGWAPSFELLRQGSDTVRCLHPHIGAINKATTVSCFTETGALFHAGGHGGH